MNFQPTTLDERMSSLDILRGFSMLGILLVNILAFNLPVPHLADLHEWFTEYEDIVWYQTLQIYVQSSFYPLLSLLFGYGLAMQWMKAERTGTNFFQFAPKRFVVLFLLGAIHAFLIWWGDILMMYAFCGFFLLLFIRFRGGWLFTFGLVLNGFWQLLILLVYFLSGLAHSEVEPMPVDIVTLNAALEAYGIGSWGDAFFQRLTDLTVQLSLGMWIQSLFTILPYMLIGAAFAKWRLIERAKELKGLWMTLAVLGVALGLFIKSAPFMFTRTYLLDYLKVYVGGPILAIGYIAVIVVLCLLPFIPKLLGPIAKAGRMSLTIYMMQSIICTILFYNFGFGLYGKADVKMSVIIAVGIFISQVAFAEIWFMKFKQGPLEWIVKKVTYRKMIAEK